MAQEITIARVYLREADKGNRESLMREILKILHDERRVKGVTVSVEIAGFGETGEVTSGDPLHILSSSPGSYRIFRQPGECGARYSGADQPVTRRPHRFLASKATLNATFLNLARFGWRVRVIRGTKIWT